jgi:DNA polymerase III epsilon subunit-like protein
MAKQLGFDLDYVDPLTQKAVPWAKYDPNLIKEIADAPWKIVDTETTGLTPDSDEQKITAKEFRQGKDTELRQRITTVLYPIYHKKRNTFSLKLRSFDMDTLTNNQQTEVANACLSHVFIAHNAGFDLYWLLQHGKKLPTKVLDTILMGRLLQPTNQLKIIEIFNNKESLYSADMMAWANKVLMSKKSGDALADRVATHFQILLPKDLQKAKNWTKPFLDQNDFYYATDDCKFTLKYLCYMFGLPDYMSYVHGPKIEFDEEKEYSMDIDFLKRYEKIFKEREQFALIEPQVYQIVLVRQKGMPCSNDNVMYFRKKCEQKVKELSQSIIEQVNAFRESNPKIPSIDKYLHNLASMDKGATQDFRRDLGQVFQELGLPVEVTEKTGLPKIGEKDLRKIKAGVIDNTKTLYKTWVDLAKSKKAGNMVLEVAEFSKRSADGRIHPLLSHGPITGRLASAEPNSQQFPRDQDFRAIIKAREGHKIVASDYSALDMRVGGALAIRAQKRIQDAFFGKRDVAEDVLFTISKVYETKESELNALTKKMKQQEDTFFEKLSIMKERYQKIIDPSKEQKKVYWEKYREFSRTILLSKFAKRLAQVKMRANESKTEFWGSLKDAFDIPNMDIHTWTALSFQGRSPKDEFVGLDNSSVAKKLKELKKELGDARQNGKVGNLSLLYAMQTFGLIDTAAKNYATYWDYETADNIRRQWLDTYIEIDLWHLWTELNPYAEVWVPNPERGGILTKKMVYESYTLADRLIYAQGINAALSYEDQSSGADILGTVMNTLYVQYPDVFNCAINQVHDELVLEIPTDKVESYTKIVEDVMVDSANKFTNTQWGVKCEVSPAIGDVWLKD